MSFPLLGSPKPSFFDSSGSPLVSGTLSILEPTDDTNKASYPTADDADAATNANVNPIVLDGRGEPPNGLWGIDGFRYKLVLKDSNGTTIWTQDDIGGSGIFGVTAAETSAGVTIVNYKKEPGNVLRYGTNTTPGTTDMTTAIQTAVDVAEALPNGVVFFPTISDYRITSPIINDSGGVSFIGEGRGATLSGGQNPGTVIYLDSSTAGDYCIKLSDTSFSGGGITISDLGFFGTNNANNQGGVLIAGRASRMSIERCEFNTFTGYAIGRDPSVTSYTQNNAIRDVGFYNVGGCYGLISEPATSANYIAETLLTIDNVNLDNGLNSTDVKPYIWDFRASRNVDCGIMLNEGSGVAGVTAIMAFAGNTGHRFRTLHNEITGTQPTYSIILLDDTTNQFLNDSDSLINIGWFSNSLPVRFDGTTGGQEAAVYVEDWNFYLAASVSDLVSFEGAQGRLEVERMQVKVPFAIPESHFGRLVLGQFGGDDEVPATITQRSMELGRWDGTYGSLDDTDFGYFFVDASGGTVASSALETDGNFKVMRYTGTATAVPVIEFWFDLPSAWQGAYVTMAIRYRSTIDAGDTGTIFQALYSDNNHFDDLSGFGQLVENGTEYSLAILTARVGSQAAPNKFWVRHIGTNPTVAPIVRIQSIQAWLGQPKDIGMAAVASDTTQSFTRSDGTTGGATSAGAGNQFVELNVNGTTYKVLHDGTV